MALDYLPKPMHLTLEELVELTHYKTPKRQINALMHMGFKYVVRPDGTVAVLRAHVEKIMGITDSKAENRGNVKPNFGAIYGR
jgi:hypothetical protein